MHRTLAALVIAACGAAPAPPISSTRPAVHEPVAPTDGWTPLMRAAQDGDLAAIDELLASGAAIDASSPEVYGGATAYLIALEYGKAAAAKHLLERGASHAGRLGTDGIVLAAREGADDVIDFLVRRGVKVSGPRALAAAAKYDHASSIGKLLAAGAELDGANRDDHDFTPLMVAAMSNKLAATRALLDAGARPDAADRDGSTALHWAVFGARPVEIHEYPIDGGPHDTYWEPQHAAPIVELLIARGAAIDAVRRDGNTPLHEAAALDVAVAARVLVGAGANRALRNHAGKTPHDLAKERSNSVVPIVR